ncbi:MAG: hypothetical protein KF868_06760 [Acidobacteria bacterium]|nr:hypothetical protein [Acidobacteriota bacterium]MCW5968810.1 hypothetical protein [Blastocatellales bacterium]
MNCPSTEEIMDYLRGAIRPVTGLEVGAHLATGCPACAEQRQWLGEVLAVTAGDRSYDFPAATITRVVEWYKEQTAGKAGLIRKLAAQLVFDSLQPSHLAPVRSGMAGAGAAAGRQVLYRAEGYDIDLRFEGGDESDDEDLIGQILPGDRPPQTSDRVAVRLLRDELEVAASRANARGVFKFARVRSGTYDLMIDVPEGEILISRIATARAV